MKKSNIFNHKVNRFTKTIFAFSLGALSLSISSNLISCNNNSTNYDVTFNSTCLDLIGESKANSGKDYTCSFKIKDDVIASRYMDNIDLNTMSVTINDQALPVEAFSFIYQTNAKNTFTIQKQYITGNLEIHADLTKRTQKHNCYFFEYDICDYASFKNIEISYPTRVGDKNAIDMTKTTTKDNIYMKDDYDVALLDKEDHEPIAILGTAYNQLILREDNALKLTIKANDNKTLPKNIWLRSNARYTKKDEDFTITYASDYKSAVLEIPYYFIRDNGSIRLNPDVEP